MYPTYVKVSRAVVEKFVETSVTKGLDKKAEWTKQTKDVVDTELRQTIKTALATT